VSQEIRPSYRFGPFRLEPRERRLLRDGTQVHLAPRVFDTLVRLVSARGSVVTRQELLAEVWGGSVVEEGNLTSNIWVLRRTLGQDAIETVPKTGYRFVAAIESGEPPESTRQPRPVLAVLPFRTLAGSQPDPALEQGLADLLVTLLSTVPEFIVRPLRATARFAPDEDPLTVGREIGAHAVVEASLQIAAEQVRINARLLRVADGASLWAESLDAPRGSLFEVEDRLAHRLAEALLGRFDVYSTRPAAVAPPRPQALQLYLHGRNSWERREPRALDRALSFYSRAVALDPEFAFAWAGIADVHAVRSMVSDARPADCFVPAREAIRRALAIDPALAEAHSASAAVSFWYEWDWSAVAEGCRRALAASPSLISAHVFSAHMSSNIGQHVEALETIDDARAIDPTSMLLQNLRATFLVHARRFHEALETFDDATATNPDFWIARLNRGKLLLHLDRVDEADVDLQHAAALNPLSAQPLSMLAAVAARRGDRAGARRILGQLEARGQEQWVPPTDLVIAQLACGEPGAVDGLERAYADRDPRLTFLAVDTKWDAVQDDPRVQEMCVRMRLRPHTASVE
jgi:DNA-binding winged helix-turn-helix (wHTH) protein/tetratricopeptide (TPR) repeat protein